MADPVDVITEALDRLDGVPGPRGRRQDASAIVDILTAAGWLLLDPEQVTYQYGYGALADGVVWYPGETPEWVRKVSDPMRGERVYRRLIGAPEVTPDA